MGSSGAPASLTYTPASETYAHGTAITPWGPPTFSGGAPLSYAVSPALPAGLVLDTTTGVISGTPASTTASATYVVTATNTAGNTTASLTIDIT